VDGAECGLVWFGLVVGYVWFGPCVVVMLCRVSCVVLRKKTKTKTFQKKSVVARRERERETRARKNHDSSLGVLPSAVCEKTKLQAILSITLHWQEEEY
jgi:hypothetical protein